MVATSFGRGCAVGVAALLLVGCSQRIEQPLSFNHRKHVESDIECADCHRHFRDAAFAGLPGIGVCMDCHEGDESNEPNMQVLQQYAAEGEDVPWQRVYDLADHVYYSHRRHVRVAGLTCEGCHGAIGTLTVPPERPLVQQTMAWCLDCHEEKNATTDCIHCHR